MAPANKSTKKTGAAQQKPTTPGNRTYMAGHTPYYPTTHASILTADTPDHSEPSDFLEVKQEEPEVPTRDPFDTTDEDEESKSCVTGRKRGASAMAPGSQDVVASSVASVMEEVFNNRDDNTPKKKKNSGPTKKLDVTIQEFRYKGVVVTVRICPCRAKSYPFLMGSEEWFGYWCPLKGIYMRLFCDIIDLIHFSSQDGMWGSFCLVSRLLT